jgi:intracellular septation protein
MNLSFLEHGVTLAKKTFTKNFAIQTVIDFGPIVVFLIGFAYANFIEATKLLLIATVLACVWSFIREKRLALFPLFVSALTLLFGGATIAFRNPRILILRDTVYDFIFAFAILIGLNDDWFLLKFLFPSFMKLHKEGWRLLSYYWVAFFIFAGTANEVLRRIATEEMWVWFKVFMIIITPLFAIVLYIIISKNHAEENK